VHEIFYARSVLKDSTGNYWHEKSVLVTGGTGLVGSWLVKRLLDDGAHVTCLILDFDFRSELFRSGNIDEVSTIAGNLASLSTVKRAVFQNECSTIFHLGAQTIVRTALLDPVQTFESNIQGTWNVLEVARNSGGLVTKVLIASSDKAYGSVKTLPYHEDMPLQGVSPYDVSKSCADLLSTTYAKIYGVPLVIARCGNIYGGGDLNWNRIVPGTIRSLLLGEQPQIRSDGLSVRDYIYVEDAVDAYLSMAIGLDDSEIVGEAFNFSREEPMTVLEMYEQVCESVTGKYVEPQVLNTATHEILSQFLSSKKARDKLGWQSVFSIKEGLKRTVDWYRDFLQIEDI
jgi:CDP-glucose 4,6-dehydratase